MHLVFYILFILLSIIKPKSIFITNALSLFLAFEAIFSTNLADISIYESRFLYYQEMSSYSEYGFTKIIQLFHYLNLSFDDFRAFIIIIFIFTLRWFIIKHTNYCAFSLALYSIFPYCIDIVQLRNALAMVFLIKGIDILLCENGWKSNIKFVILILFATTIHFSFIVYIVLLIARLINIQKTISVLAIIQILFLVLTFFNTIFLSIASSVISIERLNIILDFASRYDIGKIINFQIGTIFSTMFASIVVYMARIKYAKIGLKKQLDTTNIILKFQLLSLSVIPLMLISIDLYRIPRNMIWLSYLFWNPSLFEITNSHIFTKRLLNTLFIISIVVTLFYIQIYRMGNFDTTFKEIFIN